jgi:hypothetical protein
MPTNSTPPGHGILRPSRGPSDEEIDRLLAIHQSGIAVFHHALRNAVLPATPTSFIIEA